MWTQSASRRKFVFQPQPIGLERGEGDRRGHGSGRGSFLFPQPHPGAAGILGDELDAGRFEGILKFRNRLGIAAGLAGLKIELRPAVRVLQDWEEPATTRRGALEALRLIAEEKATSRRAQSSVRSLLLRWSISRRSHERR
jgi:hypothetical protein